MTHACVFRLKAVNLPQLQQNRTDDGGANKGECHPAILVEELGGAEKSPCGFQTMNTKRWSNRHLTG